jgi:DNA-directed RNA polymerase subunit RPC12/RpoP
VLYGMLELSIRCPKCDGPIPLNGPWEVAHCDRCQADVDVPHDYWTDLLSDIAQALKTELQEGEGTNATIFGNFHTTMMYGRLKPYCLGCKEDFEPRADAAEEYVHKCPSCGHETLVAPAPAWLREEYPAARVVVNATPQGKVEGESAAASGPIAFSCIKCGGALEVDGSERLVPCPFCGVKVYLPDDLWLRLHPAKTKARWFVGFDEGKIKAEAD